MYYLNKLYFSFYLHAVGGRRDRCQDEFIQGMCYTAHVAQGPDPVSVIFVKLHAGFAMEDF